MMVEKIAAKRLIKSTYRAKHSTETALMKVRNDITMAIDTGQSAILVLLDLSAAFDTVEVDLWFVRSKITLAWREVP